MDTPPLRLQITPQPANLRVWRLRLFRQLLPLLVARTAVPTAMKTDSLHQCASTASRDKPVFTTSGMSGSLRNALELVKNRALATQYAASIDLVPEGTAVHRAFDRPNLMPPFALRLMTIGEETGKLAPMLLKAAAVLAPLLLRR